MLGARRPITITVDAQCAIWTEAIPEWPSGRQVRDERHLRRSPAPASIAARRGLAHGHRGRRGRGSTGDTRDRTGLARLRPARADLPHGALPPRRLRPLEQPMVRRPRAPRLQRHRSRRQRADRPARARRHQRHRVCRHLRAHPALLVRPDGVARQPVVRARHGHQPHRRPHDVRLRRGAGARRDLRAATSPGRHCRGVRDSRFAREPTRRRVPRDRRHGLGGITARATQAGARAPRGRNRADRRHRIDVPHRRLGAVRTVGVDLGPQPLPHRRDRLAPLPGGALGRRALRPRRARRRSSCPARSVATSAGSISTSPGRSSRAHCSPAGASYSPSSPSRC